MVSFHHIDNVLDVWVGDVAEAKAVQKMIGDADQIGRIMGTAPDGLWVRVCADADDLLTVRGSIENAFEVEP